MKSTTDNIDPVKSGLQAAARSFKTAGLLRSGIFAVALILGWLLLWHCLDVLLILPSGARSFAVRSSLSLAAAGVIYLLYHLFNPVSPKTIAAMIEAREPSFRQEISTALQWEDVQKSIEGYSPDLLLALRKKMAKALSLLDHKKIFSGPSLRLKNTTLALSAVLALSLLIWPGSCKLTWQRFYNPDGICGNWEGIRIRPCPARLASGETFTAELSLAGLNKRQFYLSIQGPQNLQKIKFQDSGNGRLQAEAENILEPFIYRIIQGRSQSARYSVQVYQPLTLSNLKLEISSPAYTGIRPYIQENDGSIIAPKGARVTLTALASQSLQKAGMIHDDGRMTEAYDIKDSLFKLNLTVNKNSRYRLWAKGKTGDTLLHGLEYSITALEDARPAAEIISPADDWPLPEGMPAEIQLRFSDDFGLSRAALYIRDTQTEKVYQLKIYPAVLDTQIFFVWNSSESFLLPGDSVLYWAEVWDNDATSGPKNSKSKVQKFKVPTREEFYKSAAQADSAYQQNLDQAQKQNQSLKQEMERLSQAVKENRKMDWQQKAAVEEALKKQEELVSRMEQTAEEARQDVKQQAQGFKFDPQTVEKLAELKNLFDQVASEEMRQAMERMQQALQNMDRKQIEQALENFKFSQEEFQQRLDAAIASLKELKQEQMLSLLKQEVDKMAAEQKAVKDSLGKVQGKPASNNLKQRQEQLAKDLETSLQQMNELAKQMSEGNPEASQKLKQSMQKAQSQNTIQKMRQAGRKMESGQNQEAQGLQQEALTDLTELSAGLQGAKNAMGSQRSQAASKAMREKAKELIKLSQQQEQLNQKMENGSNDPVDLAWRQQVLQRQAARVKQKLDELTRKNFLLSPQASQALQEAAKQMENSASSLSEGRGQQAGTSGKAAQGLLNQSAAALIQSSSKSGGSSGSGDMMGDLEGMSGMQQNINQASQGLMPMPGGEQGGLSQEARSQMARLAAEQEAVRQGMEEFNQKYGGRSDLAGKLDDLVQEMQKVADNMKNNQLDRQTIERQEKILARMLSAGHSLKEQDTSPQRQAQPGRDQTPDRPAQPNKGDPAWKNLPDWRNQPYPLEYRELLEKYYESLGR
ncbi:hypothetical protein HY768_03595 [candidate division TA06 bacterium]|uniref:DUF4175 family protein n=1 Tax=candidate division TA06 bacterium TaxID=2250710 RepID=A0A933I8R2_UNCT6|nr:hypothetical protein [candidate division TA06 bacterium]